MTEEFQLTPVDGDRNPIEVAAHPVIKVFCDQEGIVCYARHQEAPIRLDQVSPKRSRVAALERCAGLLKNYPEGTPERDMPISITGLGLTYEQLKIETYEACLRSREIEAERTEAAEAKRARYRN